MRRKKYEEVIEDFNKHGIILLWTKEEFDKEYKNNTTIMPYICSCGNNKDKKSFKNLKQGKKCSECVLERKQNTCFKNYGVINPSHSKEIQDKKIETNFKKYGENNYMKTDEGKERFKQIFFEKYGETNPMKVKEFKAKATQTLIQNYNVTNPMHSEEIRKKIENTVLNKYNVSNILKSSEIRDKIKNTIFKNYGVSNPFQSKEIKTKIKNYWIENFGVDNPSQLKEIYDKIIQTNIEKYGVNSPLQSEEIKEKIKQTNIKKYGCENAMQNPDILDKSQKNSFKLKEYLFPSGNIIYYQGYENFALDELIFDENIEEEDIITSKKDVPEIWYEDSEGIKHRYFTDIYMPKQNKCIEVKSEYTYLHGIKNLFLKRIATTKCGYIFDLRIYDKNGNIISENEMTI